MYGRQPSIRIALPISGLEPHTTGPIPGSSAALTTAAPAPSPNRTQVERSVQSVTSDSFSAPMTIALRAAPARIAWSTVASAYGKPEHAVLTSNAPGALMPSFAATRQATLGDQSTELQVATTIRSMSAAPRPEPASALPAAAVAMSATVSLSAMRLVTMPTRSRIHWSLVSMICDRSSLVTTFCGCALPIPSTRLPRAPRVKLRAGRSVTWRPPGEARRGPRAS